MELDQRSLTKRVDARKPTAPQEFRVVEETGTYATSMSYMKRGTASRWTTDDTKQFYDGMVVCMCLARGILLGM